MTIFLWVLSIEEYYNSFFLESRNSSIWVYTVLLYVLSDEESEPLRSGLSGTVSKTISGCSEQEQDLFSELYYSTFNSNPL